jgi:hypothetical protein
MKAKIIKADTCFLDGAEVVVSFTPRWLGIFLGRRPKIKTYKWTGSVYTFGGEKKWYDKESGKVVGRLPMLDNYLRKNAFNKPPYKSTEKVCHYDAFEGMSDLKKNLNDVRIQSDSN